MKVRYNPPPEKKKSQIKLAEQNGVSYECVQKARKILIFNSYLSHISNDDTRLGFP